MFELIKILFGKQSRIMPEAPRRESLATYVVIYFDQTGELTEYLIEATSTENAEIRFRQLYQNEVFDVYKSTK